MDAQHDLELLVKTRQPLIAVETWEEDRLEEALRRVARKLGIPLHIWTLTGGLARDGKDSALYDTREPERALANLDALKEPGVALLKDLHHYLDRHEIVRAIRDLCRRKRTRRVTIVLSAAKVDLPAELERIAARFDLALPTRDELRALAYEVLHDLGRHYQLRVELSDAEFERLLDGLKGLTMDEAERAMTRALLDDLALTASDVEEIQAVRRDLLSSDGLLEYVPPRDKELALGGFERFKAWLEKRHEAFTPEAHAFGLEPPRGVVLLGVQGCGKSMAARTVATGWGLPLLRLEPGRIYDKWVGQSEQNLDRALKLAERMAPCVLLIDEIEKGFAFGTSGDSDGGISKRIVGRLLSWLQDREAPVFVVATCNRVQDVPPEMLRKGRFDEIFFVDLPGQEEREEILALHLTLRKRDVSAFDLPAVAKAAEGFSGAELEQAVVAALYTAFARGTDIDTGLLLGEIEATRPLSVVRREDIEALRAWAEDRTVPVG